MTPTDIAELRRLLDEYIPVGDYDDPACPHGEDSAWCDACAMTRERLATAAMRALPGLLDRIEALEAALERYGAHDGYIKSGFGVGHCQIDDGSYHHRGGTCTCGYDAARGKP